jgi:hypothetical protein
VVQGQEKVGLLEREKRDSLLEVVGFRDLDLKEVRLLCIVVFLSVDLRTVLDAR